MCQPFVQRFAFHCVYSCELEATVVCSLRKFSSSYSSERLLAQSLYSFIRSTFLPFLNLSSSMASSYLSSSEGTHSQRLTFDRLSTCTCMCITYSIA